MSERERTRERVLRLTEWYAAASVVAGELQFGAIEVIVLASASSVSQCIVRVSSASAHTRRPPPTHMPLSSALL